MTNNYLASNAIIYKGRLQSHGNCASYKSMDKRHS